MWAFQFSYAAWPSSVRCCKGILCPSGQQAWYWKKMKKSLRESGWWFGTFYIYMFFLLGKQFLNWLMTNIFQRGWNHQPGLFQKPYPIISNRNLIYHHLSALKQFIATGSVEDPVGEVLKRPGGWRLSISPLKCFCKNGGFLKWEYPQIIHL